MRSFMIYGVNEIRAKFLIELCGLGSHARREDLVFHAKIDKHSWFLQVGQRVDQVLRVQSEAMWNQVLNLYLWRFFLLSLDEVREWAARYDARTTDDIRVNDMDITGEEAATWEATDGDGVWIDSAEIR